MIVEEIMSREPIVLHATDTIRRALFVAREGDVRHLPVVENRRLVGMVSDRDLRDARAAAFISVTIDDIGLDEPVSKIMSSDVISVDAETQLADVIDLMIEHKVGALPVIDASSAALIGIVSYVDVLRAARAQL